jgi:hypothetical protein
MLWIESHTEDFRANLELAVLLNDFADLVLPNVSQNKMAAKLKRHLASKLAGEAEEEGVEFKVIPPFSVVSPKCINEGNALLVIFSYAIRLRF